MRIPALFLAIAACTAPLRAQEGVDTAMIGKIRAEGLDRSGVLALYGHLTDVIGPRLTGSPAYRQAADWALGQLRGWGLAAAHREAFDFGRGWTLEKQILEMTAPRYFPLIGYPEAWSPPTQGRVEGTPVYIGDLDADRVRGMAARLRGAIVLPVPPQTAFITEDRPQPADADEPVRSGAPPMLRNAGAVPARELIALLREVGAAAVLRPNQGEHGTLFVLGSRGTTDDAVPSIILAAEHYNLLVRMLQAGESPRLRVEVGVHYHAEDTNGYNVLADIPGTDPALQDEVVMIGAHLDSWHSATGGTDNADGSAIVMEAMRILHAVGARPRRTIRVALWGGEEEGLLGSRAWVESHLAGEANRAASERFQVYFNDDPGGGPIYGFYAEENAAAKSLFDAWLAPLHDLGAKQNVIAGIGSTDHVSFTRSGVPGFTAIKDYTHYDTRTHHTNADFYERVSEADLKQSAIVMAVFAWQAAMREKPFPRPPT
jgi:hypothetical protein